MLKLTTDKHEASRGLSATAELLVYQTVDVFSCSLSRYCIKYYAKLAQLRSSI